MKTMHKALFILSLPLLLELVAACCNCDESTNISFYHCDLSVTNAEYNFNEFETSAFEGDTLLFDQYAVKISVQRSQETCSIRHSLSLFPQAHALSCDCPPVITYEPLNHITNIQVFTQNDFDENHPSESDITSYFRVHHWGSEIEINQFIEQLESYYYGDISPEIMFSLILTNPPNENSTQQFTVVITLDTGNTLEMMAEPIFLNH